MNFMKERFERLVTDAEKWWEGELERPLIQVSLFDNNGYREQKRQNLRDIYDFDLSPAEVAAHLEKRLDKTVYLGDGFPTYYMRTTGYLGVALGQGYDIDRERGTVWYKKMDIGGLEELEIKLDLSNPLYLRSLELLKAVQEHFQGGIALGIGDLGGVIDILAAMRGAYELLMDLYDCPEELSRLSQDVHREFMNVFNATNSMIDTSVTPGYTDWATMLSRRPYFMTQCDFAYMISTEMFDEFCKPILVQECKKIDRVCYHLDGEGQVRHLDSMLSIEELKGVQWIPGEGATPVNRWPEVFRKIRKANKIAQAFITGVNELSYIDDIVEQVGSTKGLCFICTGDTKDRDQFEKYLNKYDVPMQ